LSENNFDAIVIGSGLGGLTAAALYAKQGKRVLVLERHDKFGGAATVYCRKKVNIEVGLHELDGLDELDVKRRLWKELDLEKQIRTVPVGAFYKLRCVGDGSSFVMPDGVDNAIQALSGRFPQHSEAIQRYFSILCSIRASMVRYVEANRTPLWWLINGPIFPLRFWPILRYGWSTLGGFVDKLFGDDEQIKITLAANYQYYSDDPYRLSLTHFAAAQISYHTGGGHFVHAGSQGLSDALVEQVRTAGGVVEKRRNVTDILMKDGAVVGVRHERLSNLSKKHIPGRDIQEHFAPQLFANAAPHCIEKMLPETYRNSFMKPYHGRRLSPSLWCLFLGFDRSPSEFGVDAYSTFVIPEHYTSFRDGPSEAYIMADPDNERMPPYTFVDYSQIDSGLNNEGRHFAVMCGIDHIDNWDKLDDEQYETRKQQWQDRLIAALSTQFPNIDSSIVYTEMGTARSMQRYLNTPGGAVYGFSPDAPRYVTGISTSRTPVKGIYIASAFGGFGGGFTGAMMSGAHAAGEALEDS